MVALDARHCGVYVVLIIFQLIRNLSDHTLGLYISKESFKIDHANTTNEDRLAFLVNLVQAVWKRCLQQLHFRELPCFV